MNSPAQDYAKAHEAVREFAAGGSGNDPAGRLYMLARAALLQVRDVHGNCRAAEMAYALGDEMTGPTP